MNIHDLVNQDGTVNVRTSLHKSTGYLRFWRDGKAYYVHRVVAEAYLGKSELHVNHIDGNKLNNHPSNLEYVTRGGNAEHAHRTGLINVKGEGNGRAKITHEIARLIRESTKDSLSLAKEYGVSRSSVYDIKHRRTWNV